MITLRNVVDTRSNKFHSIAVIKERMVKYFVPAEPAIDEPIISDEASEEEK